MKTKKSIIQNLYSCVFQSDKGLRTIKVVAPSFGRAACTAYDASSVWEDVDAFELTSINLIGIVSLF